jgi:hypothetical protein
MHYLEGLVINRKLALQYGDVVRTHQRRVKESFCS